MNNYIQIVVEKVDPALKDLLIAELSALNFEGFEEYDTCLKAFIPEADYNELLINGLFNNHRITYCKSVILPQNWNALWESNFEPVIVDDFCEVRADFHSPSHVTKYEIIITPKMSFGTGHHATTYMMIRQMKDIDFKEKKVADFGTGTGILAILAEKLGSNDILALDNDDWSIENAQENINKNHCKAINLQKADSFFNKEMFDIIIANINKNVILDNLGGLVFGLNDNGFLLISGILKEDEGDMVKAFSDHNISCIKTVERNNWITMLLVNN